MFNPKNYEPMHFDTVDRYISGKLPAVHIGDCFQDRRYQILNKLGQGGYANVWLARDNQTNCNISIKTIAASDSSNNRELAILQCLNNGDTQHPGYKHTPRLLDFFYYDSLSGRSLFLVIERLGPSLEFMMVEELVLYMRFSLSLSRQVSRQLLLAVDYLHTCGIVHGDIHLGNVLFCIPTTL